MVIELHTITKKMASSLLQLKTSQLGRTETQKGPQIGHGCSILSNLVVKLSTAIISLSNSSPILLDMLYLVVESKPFRRFCLISCSLFHVPSVAPAVYVPYVLLLALQKQNVKALQKQNVPDDDAML